jgi:ABC-type antimicrobial peptide transport system permease subunit
MLGVIVGVVSVVTIVSLGEGVKREATSQINHYGGDLLTVRPGKIITRDSKGNVTDVKLMNALSPRGSLGNDDLKAIQSVKGTKLVVPLSSLSGVATLDDMAFDQGFVIGTSHALPQALNQKVEFGTFFEEKGGQNVAVIGRKVAEKLFHENVPIGRSFEIRGQTFIVGGIFEEFEHSSFVRDTDYNYAIFIPFDTAKAINGDQTPIQEILVKPTKPTQMNQVADDLNSVLKKVHGGQDDYTILRPKDTVAVADKVLTMLTGLVSAIAATSLIVGGIGIMNIMLVLVAERTHEIGVRKAVGATNGQILAQFLVEGAALSAMGGFVGIILSLVVNYFIRLLTNLHPVISWQIMLASIGVSLIVGVFFGIAPALKAAQKDPIQALRSVI